LLALASLWLISPFAAGALLGSSPRARRFAGRHYPGLVLLGLGGIALVALGAFVLAQPLSFVALGIGGPLSGLSFWVRRDEGGDDGPGWGDDDDPGPPPPGGDWERIVEQFERHVERVRPLAPAGPPRSPEPSSPRAPALV
jgi:hypothetical protein